MATRRLVRHRTRRLKNVFYHRLRFFAAFCLTRWCLVPKNPPGCTMTNGEAECGHKLGSSSVFTRSQLGSYSAATRSVLGRVWWARYFKLGGLARPKLGDRARLGIQLGIGSAEPGQAVPLVISHAVTTLCQHPSWILATSLQATNTSHI